MVDLNVLEKAINQIENSVKVLENSKYEKSRCLVAGGRQVKIPLLNEDLKNLFNLENLESVEKFTSSDKFTKNKQVKMIEFRGGFIILR